MGSLVNRFEGLRVSWEEGKSVVQAKGIDSAKACKQAADRSAVLQGFGARITGRLSLQVPLGSLMVRHLPIWM